MRVGVNVSVFVHVKFVGFCVFPNASARGVSYVIVDFREISYRNLGSDSDS